MDAKAVEKSRKLAVAVFERAIEIVGEEPAGFTETFEEAADDDESEFPWCEPCQSYHHPNNPTCVLRTGAPHHSRPANRHSDTESADPKQGGLPPWPTR